MLSWARRQEVGAGVPDALVLSPVKPELTPFATSWLADRKWGQAYLTRGFFHMLGETMPEHVMLAAAQDGDQLVAGVVYALRSLLNQMFVPHRSAERLLRNASKTAGRNQLASKHMMDCPQAR